MASLSDLDFGTSRCGRNGILSDSLEYSCAYCSLREIIVSLTWSSSIERLSTIISLYLNTLGTWI